MKFNYGTFALLFLFLISSFVYAQPSSGCEACDALNDPSFVDGEIVLTTFEPPSQSGQTPAIDATFFYTWRNRQNQPIRSSVQNAPLIVIAQRTGAPPVFETVYTNSEGKARFTIPPSLGSACYDYTFVFCHVSAGCGYDNCMTGAGIKSCVDDGVGTANCPLFSNVPVQGAVPADSQLPLTVKPVVARVTRCPPPVDPIAGELPLFCIPLALIFALLGGALFATGRNPLSPFDFSTPRVSKPYRYVARGVGISADVSAPARAVAGAIIAVKEKNKEAKEKGKARTAEEKKEVAEEQVKGAHRAVHGEVERVRTAGGAVGEVKPARLLGEEKTGLNYKKKISSIFSGLGEVFGAPGEKEKAAAKRGPELTILPGRVVARGGGETPLAGIVGKAITGKGSILKKAGLLLTDLVRFSSVGFLFNAFGVTDWMERSINKSIAKDAVESQKKYESEGKEFTLKHIGGGFGKEAEQLRESAIAKIENGELIITLKTVEEGKEPVYAVLNKDDERYKEVRHMVLEDMHDNWSAVRLSPEFEAAASGELLRFLAKEQGKEEALDRSWDKFRAETIEAVQKAETRDFLALIQFASSDAGFMLLIEAAKKQLGREPSSPQEVFDALRKGKDYAGLESGIAAAISSEGEFYSTVAKDFRASEKFKATREKEEYLVLQSERPLTPAEARKLKAAEERELNEFDRFIKTIEVDLIQTPVALLYAEAHDGKTAKDSIELVRWVRSEGGGSISKGFEEVFLVPLETWVGKARAYRDYSTERGEEHFISWLAEKGDGDINAGFKKVTGEDGAGLFIAYRLESLNTNAAVSAAGAYASLLALEEKISEESSSKKKTGLEKKFDDISRQGIAISASMLASSQEATMYHVAIIEGNNAPKEEITDVLTAQISMRTAALNLSGNVATMVSLDSTYKVPTVLEIPVIIPPGKEGFWEEHDNAWIADYMGKKAELLSQQSLELERLIKDKRKTPDDKTISEMVVEAYGKVSEKISKLKKEKPSM